MKFDPKIDKCHHTPLVATRSNEDLVHLACHDKHTCKLEYGQWVRLYDRDHVKDYRNGRAPIGRALEHLSKSDVEWGYKSARHHCFGPTME